MQKLKVVMNYTINYGVSQAAQGPGFPLQSFFSCLKKSISAAIPHAAFVDGIPQRTQLPVRVLH